jgi:hypothetical protein
MGLCILELLFKVTKVNFGELSHYGTITVQIPEVAEALG